MTGLNMESFLRLLRADLGAWAGLGAIVVVLALMTWTSWGSRRALWKCLVLSVAVHLGLLLYGGFLTFFLHLLRIEGSTRPPAIEIVERVRIAPKVEEDVSASPKVGGGKMRKVEPWDRDRGPVALEDPASRVPRPEPVVAAPPIEAPKVPEPLASETVVAETAVPTPAQPEPVAIATPGASVSAPELAPGEAPDPVREEASAPRVAQPTPVEPMLGGTENLRARTPRPDPAANRTPNVAGPRPAAPPLDPVVEPSAPAVAPPLVSPILGGLTRPPAPAEMPTGPALERPNGLPDDAPPAEVAAAPSPRPAASASPTTTLPESDIRQSIRPTREPAQPGPIVAPSRLQEPRTPVAMARVTPSGSTGLSTLPRPNGRRSLADVPTVYRSRLDPNRTTLAQRAGASAASEQAVERALEWLAKHQDADGRWDGATARTRDGVTLVDDDSYTVHCDPGDICFGECYYWEADTALTGLSLLAYLGAGYTQMDGKHAQTVGRGLDFLLKSQKPDGDLRGPSIAVGMYCHAMATLALAEAFALTGDPRLRDAVEKGIGFLVRSRAKDGLAWRYVPGEAPAGDTSILGWAVMALKTGKVAGVAIPASVQTGTQTWLTKVAAGQEGGLARYRPWEKVTATMTAEAWACRQFLGYGGPSSASDEAAAFLLEHGPNVDPYNIYYWYYGTLAMFQRGGEDWKTWNGQVRDQIVRRQQTKGHKAGSWDPDETQYGTHGGRIYGTALATLTLEVYYRYLRLYEAAPATPGSAPARAVDAGARRAGGVAAPPGR